MSVTVCATLERLLSVCKRQEGNIAENAVRIYVAWSVLYVSRFAHNRPLQEKLHSLFTSASHWRAMRNEI